MVHRMATDLVPGGCDALNLTDSQVAVSGRSDPATVDEEGTVHAVVAKHLSRLVLADRSVVKGKNDGRWLRRGWRRRGSRHRHLTRRRGGQTSRVRHREGHLERAGHRVAVLDSRGRLGGHT